MKAAFVILTLSHFISSLGLASPPPRGATLCTGDCNYVDQGALMPERMEKEARRPLASVESIPLSKPEQKKEPKKVKTSRPSQKSGAEVPTNLPAYFASVKRAGFQFTGNSIYERENASIKLKGVRSGDSFQAIIEQSLKASTSVPTPVKALATSGKVKGGIFVGEATLDKELKRILVTFTKLRMPNDEVYNLEAKMLSPSGQIGLEGDYHSETGKFFIAELASAAATGFADSTIQRNQTAYGGWSQQPSLANYQKQAAVSALSKTTDRFAEQMRNAPEFTETKAYQEIQVILKDDPEASGS